VLGWAAQRPDLPQSASRASLACAGPPQMLQHCERPLAKPQRTSFVQGRATWLQRRLSSPSSPRLRTAQDYPAAQEQTSSEGRRGVRLSRSRNPELPRCRTPHSSAALPGAASRRPRRPSTEPSSGRARQRRAAPRNSAGQASGAHARRLRAPALSTRPSRRSGCCAPPCRPARGRRRLRPRRASPQQAGALPCARPPRSRQTRWRRARRPWRLAHAEAQHAARCSAPRRTPRARERRGAGLARRRHRAACAAADRKRAWHRHARQATRHALPSSFPKV